MCGRRTCDEDLPVGLQVDGASGRVEAAEDIGARLGEIRVDRAISRKRVDEESRLLGSGSILRFSDDEDAPVLWRHREVEDFVACRIGKLKFQRVGGPSGKILVNASVGMKAQKIPDR